MKAIHIHVNKVTFFSYFTLIILILTQTFYFRNFTAEPLMRATHTPANMVIIAQFLHEPETIVATAASKSAILSACPNMVRNEHLIHCFFS